MSETAGLVLNVDDTPASRYLRTRTLRAAGFDVREAASGQEALACVAEDGPELVLLDVHLPDMSGYDVCRRIREDYPGASIAVLQISASHQQPDDHVRGLETGADGYLVEPVPAEVLVATTRALLRMRRAEAALRDHARDLEHQVSDRTARLRTNVADLEAFTYGIAHDLHTPLRAIRGFTDALGEEIGAPSPLATALMERIRLSVDHMNALIRDLLRYSPVSHEQPSTDVIDVASVMRTVLQELGQDSRNVEVQPGLPRVMGHVPLMGEILENLVTNALKFVPADRTPHVVVTAEPRGEHVRLVVEDNGIGVPAEYRERIFELFQRLHNVAEYPGTGVGLAIVRRAAERMGGRCGVEAGPEGSRFWVELPSVEADPAVVPTT